jgi:hypothetical protein
MEMENVVYLPLVFCNIAGFVLGLFSTYEREHVTFGFLNLLTSLKVMFSSSLGKSHMLFAVHVEYRPNTKLQNTKRRSRTGGVRKLRS